MPHRHCSAQSVATDPRVPDDGGGASDARSRCALRRTAARRARTALRRRHSSCDVDELRCAERKREGVGHGRGCCCRARCWLQCPRLCRGVTAQGPRATQRQHQGRPPGRGGGALRVWPNPDPDTPPPPRGLQPTPMGRSVFFFQSTCFTLPVGGGGLRGFVCAFAGMPHFGVTRGGWGMGISPPLMCMRNAQNGTGKSSGGGATKNGGAFLTPSVPDAPLCQGAEAAPVGRRTTVPLSPSKGERWPSAVAWDTQVNHFLQTTETSACAWRYQPALCPSLYAPPPPLRFRSSAAMQRRIPGADPTPLLAMIMLRWTWGKPSISPHLTSPHLTSPHLTAPHLTSPHLISPHRTSPHLTSTASRCRGQKLN